MPKNNLAASKTAASTQKHLDIAQIRDDIVILRDGTVRAVLLVSSINFALKGEDEQNALIQAYISFLNTLDFPLQIVIQSRRLNIDKYLEKLLVLERQQTNELMRQQIVDYRAYLKELLDLGYIMNGLGSIGLNAAQLDTQSLIELFYNAYNPEIVESQKMQDVSKLRIEEV